MQKLDFMVDMKLNDSWLAFAAETKQCGCLVQFLGEHITPSDAKNFFAINSYNLWNEIVQDHDDEELTKEKSHCLFEAFPYCQKCKRYFFFQVREDQSSVMEGMQICLPTTCKLLEIPRCFGQAVSSFVAQRGSCYKGSVNCNQIKVSWK